jgi:hypothetical protein
MKKKSTLILFIILIYSSLNAQDIFTSKAGKISFHSKTPMQDIDALSHKMAAVINNKTKQVYFKIQNTSFHFDEKLMEEHFNENYMESEKYPVSEFNGKIVEHVDLTQNGDHKVSIHGWLNVHGVKKEYKVASVITVHNGTIELNSNFKIKLADHKIEIPTIVFTKIAEEIEIKVNTHCKPIKKA